MKKILLLMFLVFSTISFSKGEKIKNISSIKSLELMVEEDNKVYSIKYIIPNLMKKEMLEPRSHRGEKFIYKDGIKKTYLPIFDEVIVDEKAPEENFVIETISLLQDRDKSSKDFRKLYNSGKNIQIRNKNIKIILEEMKVVENYYMPQKIKVYDSEALIGELNVSDIKINEEIDMKEFEI